MEISDFEIGRIYQVLEMPVAHSGGSVAARSYTALVLSPAPSSVPGPAQSCLRVENRVSGKILLLCRERIKWAIALSEQPPA